MKNILFLTLVLNCVSSYCQDNAYFFMDHTYQRSYANPALIDSSSIFVATGVGLDVGSEGPSYDQAILKKDGKNQLSFTHAQQYTNDKNNAFANAAIHTLDLCYPVYGYNISMGHAWKFRGALQYTKDLVEIAAYGNAPYLGEKKSISPALEYYNYNELYLGVQKDFGVLAIGARVKRLSGVQGIHTPKNVISILTDEEYYALQLNSDFQLQSSGVVDQLNTDSVSASYQHVSFDHFFGANSGWAFDIGLVFQPLENVEVSLGVIDMGDINWTEELNTYTSKKANSFEGIDLTEYIKEEDNIDLADTIRSLLELEESNEKFSTPLPQQIYLGGRYSFTDAWTLGVLVHSVKYQNTRRNALTANLSTQLTDWIQLGAQYSVRTESKDNIGLSAAIRLGKVTTILATDNVLAIVQPLSAHYASARLGISVKL